MKNVHSSPAPRWRRITTLAAAAGLACGGLVAVGPPAYALWDPTLGSSNFEIDESANMRVDAGSPAIDWKDINPNLAGAQSVTFTADQASGTGDNAFGKGSSENDAVPSVVSGSIPPNKSDLTHFGVYDGETNYVHLAWARQNNPSGTTNMDFEFNQSRTRSTNGVTPIRTPGDLLIEYHLDNGGTTATLSKRVWSGSSWSEEDALTGNAIGSINTAAIAAGDSVIGARDINTFGEASIDLQAVFGTGACRHFGSAYLKSRAADSFSSEIKDFIAPQNIDLSNCRSYVVKKIAAGGAPLAGADFELRQTVGGVTTSFPMDEYGTGIFCVDNLNLGTYTLVETVIPTGYTAVNNNSSVTIDTSSSLASCATRTAANPVVPDRTVTNNPQPGTINIHKFDDSATPLPLAGAKFKLFTDNATVGSYQVATDVPQVGSEVTTDANGDASFSNVPFGTYCIVESFTPAGYDTAAPQCVSIDAVSGGDTETLTFTDNRQHKIIVIVCHEGTNTLDSSSVTMDGSTKSSIGTAPSGITQAQLCGLGGASYGGISGHPTKSLSVTPN